MNQMYDEKENNWAQIEFEWANEINETKYVAFAYPLPIFREVHWQGRQKYRKRKVNVLWLPNTSDEWMCSSISFLLAGGTLCSAICFALVL